MKLSFYFKLGLGAICLLLSFITSAYNITLDRNIVLVVKNKGEAVLKCADKPNESSEVLYPNLAFFLHQTSLPVVVTDNHIIINLENTSISGQVAAIQIQPNYEQSLNFQHAQHNEYFPDTLSENQTSDNNYGLNSFSFANLLVSPVLSIVENIINSKSEINNNSVPIPGQLHFLTTTQYATSSYAQLALQGNNLSISNQLVHFIGSAAPDSNTNTSMATVSSLTRKQLQRLKDNAWVSPNKSDSNSGSYLWTFFRACHEFCELLSPYGTYHLSVGSNHTKKHYGHQIHPLPMLPDIMSTAEIYMRLILFNHISH